MSMKASEVGEWLRKNTGKRDHHELMPQDYVVVRPGPNFHWLMGQGSPARTDPLPAAPGPTPTSDDRRGTGAEDEALNVHDPRLRGFRHTKVREVKSRAFQSPLCGSTPERENVPA